jgi:hypothetical protein
MAKTASTNGKGFFKQLRAAFSGLSQCRDVRLDQPLQLLKDKVRIPCEDAPLELILGKKGQKLHLVAEVYIAAEGEAEQVPTPTFILYDPERFFSEISGFLRLVKGDTLILGREDGHQQAVFDYPKGVDRRHLTIVHDGEVLLFKDLSGDSGTRISPLPEKSELPSITELRMQRLREIRTIFGGPIEKLGPETALDTLRQVNELLEKEPCRPRNDSKEPGGVVNLPDKMIPIIIGDLHAQVDNLLTLLSQNEFLESMRDGKAAVVFLGDAVHKEVDGEMEEMESSLLIMDLIFRLKLWFPQQVFYIRGNHDCFSEDIGKDGIPQGLLWDRAIRKARGEAYKNEMDRFYDLLPYVALSGDFAACHAAPPKSKVTLDLLINIRRYPGLIVELTCNRLYRPNRPAGYTKGDVKRFRKSLKLAPDSDLFVGHTPLSRQDTLWLDVAGIENHHVVFSGNTPWIGVFTRVGRRLVPLRYRAERLLPIINGLPQEDEVT